MYQSYVLWYFKDFETQNVYLILTDMKDLEKKTDKITILQM